MKKSLLISILAFSVLFLVGCGKSTVTTDQAATTDETVQTKDTRDLTDKECIELVAYAFKAAQFQAQGDNANFMAWAQKTADLQAKYEMDDAQYEESCGILMTNPNFMQTVQKRMAELK